MKQKYIKSVLQIFSILILFAACNQETYNLTGFKKKNVQIKSITKTDSFLTVTILKNFWSNSGSFDFFKKDTAKPFSIQKISGINPTDSSVTFYINSRNLNNFQHIDSFNLVIKLLDEKNDIFIDSIITNNPFFIPPFTFKSLGGLLGYWPLTNNFNDYSGNLNHGKTNGNLIFSQIPGTNLTGTQFDGNSNISIPNSKTLNPSEYTISAFILPSTISDKDNLSVPISKRDWSGWGGGIEFMIYTIDKQNFGTRIIWESSGQGVYLSNVTKPFGTPTLMVITHDLNYIKIYINGNLTDSTPSGGPINGNVNEVSIGRRGTGGNHAFTGYMRDVAVWDHALTASEIQSIYQLYK